MYTCGDRKLCPNMPDIVLRKIFAEFDYKTLCRLERVCRRWMSIIHSQFRKEIHEITIERLGSIFPSATQCIPFRRLSISCPADSHDFLAGVFRRSRLSIMRMTTDLKFLADIDQVHVSKDATRKYFSNVEDLWILVILPGEQMTNKFLQMEETLFSELHQLTLQVHVDEANFRNVSEIVRSLILRHPKAIVNLELHADTPRLIFEQLKALPSLPLHKIKIICTDFDQPIMRLDELYRIMRETNINAKNITLRDWALFSDGSSALSYIPLDTFRISSCSIETVDNLVKSLQLTAAQKDPTVKKKKKVVKRKKPVEATNEETPKPAKTRKIVRKKVPAPYIKKLEIAGQCTLVGLTFLQQKAHRELERRLETAIPDMVVDCSEIYYCW